VGSSTRSDLTRAENNNVIVAVAQQASLLMPRTEWRSKYCSLMALASVSEGCYEVMEQESQYLLEYVHSCCFALTRPGSLRQQRAIRIHASVTASYTA
jgi:hypothetical protein